MLRMKSSSSLGDNGHSPRAVGALRAIRVDARYRATPERVFFAWLDPDVARRWLFATATRPIAQAEIDARAGGAFRFVDRRDAHRGEHRGEYIEIVAHRRLVFSLALVDRPAVPTRVSIEIEGSRAGCQLSLTHESVPSDLVRVTEARWTGILYGLGVTLDSLAGDPMPKRRRIVPGPVLQRLALSQAASRRESQPPRNPRSE